MVHPGHRTERALRRPPVPLHLGTAPGHASARRALTPLRITAGVVWPITSPPIREGAVLVDDDGRIVAVGRAAQLPGYEPAQGLAFPDAVLVPGFVNAHTHLELHGLRDVVREDDFFAWLQRVRALKASSPPEEFRHAARRGVREAWRYGATTVADTGTSGATVAALAELGGRGTYYHEVIAPEPARKDDALAQALHEIARLARVARVARDRVRIGVSPHAPYTAGPDLIRATAALARERGVPLAAHVAESHAECAFVVHHQGPFAELWQRRRIPLPPQAPSPVRYVAEHGLLGADLLAIHVVQADADDLALLARHGVAVAACPRSNRHHGHGDPPLAAMLEAGLTVGLGTDSAASVATLDLLAEARLARAIAACPAERAVRMLTLDGARAIGMAREVGSLDPGKWADLCAIRLSGPPDDPTRLAEAMLDAGGDAITATLIGGRLVHTGV